MKIILSFIRFMRAPVGRERMAAWKQLRRLAMIRAGIPVTRKRKPKPVIAP
jgi:hypothetical protein